MPAFVNKKIYNNNNNCHCGIESGTVAAYTSLLAYFSYCLFKYFNCTEANAMKKKQLGFGRQNSVVELRK